jgi:hypothetical protein
MEIPQFLKIEFVSSECWGKDVTTNISEESILLKQFESVKGIFEQGNAQNRRIGVISRHKSIRLVYCNTAWF